jgi:uncharacterized protein (DUF1501 family)
MNAGGGSMNGGNPANMVIGYAHQLMVNNLAGATQGINRLDFGTPWNRAGTAFAEEDSALPAGWLTLREEAGYTKSESALAVTWTSGSDMAYPFTASELSDLSQGKGALARALGVEGTPGKYNVLQVATTGVTDVEFPEVFAVACGSPEVWSDYIVAHHG